MTIKQAIRQCKANMNRELERGQLLECKLWKKYMEQLEIISVILEAPGRTELKEIK